VTLARLANLLLLILANVEFCPVAKTNKQTNKQTNRTFGRGSSSSKLNSGACGAAEPPCANNLDRAYTVITHFSPRSLLPRKKESQQSHGVQALEPPTSDASASSGPGAAAAAQPGALFDS
jgi:hypothetical protein